MHGQQNIKESPYICYLILIVIIIKLIHNERPKKFIALGLPRYVPNVFGCQ